MNYNIQTLQSGQNKWCIWYVLWNEIFSEVNLMWLYFTKSIYVKSEQVVGNNGLLNKVG